MCWQCDHPHATIDDYLGELVKIVKKNRWAVQYVEGEDRPFAYTIGLHELGLPELLVTGLNAEASARLLNTVTRYTVDGGTRLRPGEYVHHEQLMLEVVEVDHPDVHLKFAVGLFNQPIRALQLVWTDDRRHWPWDRGWSHGRRRQPVFGVRSSCPPPDGVQG